MYIPLIGLERQIKSIENELKKAINRVLEGGRFTLGENLERFEQEFAEYCGVKFAIGVASGTDALLLALKALEIDSGDEVLVSSHTFIATAAAVTHAGAKPVFVDINPKTYNIEVTNNIKISKKTKAIIPIHLYGQPVEMDKVIDFAKKYNLKVIEDACQAHGATYKGKKVGSLGDVGCFSFYPTKPLSALGDGGMITTNDPEIADKVRKLRNHGRAELNVHIMPGYTSRLDEIQAAILSVKLKYLDEWNTKRANIARMYNERLKDLAEVQLPYCINGATHVYHLYVIRTKERERLRAKLWEYGIETMIHYPTPIHLQPAYKNMFSVPPKLKNAEEATKEILSLPIFAELTEREVEYVCRAIQEYFR